MPFKYALLIFYNGVPYSGWQRQAGSERFSVQGVVEDAVFAVTRERIPVISSGRTDAGVHAIGQVAQIVLQQSWQSSDLQAKLNERLQSAQQLVRIRSVLSVDRSFHPHRCSVGKQYSYYILQGICVMP